MMDAFLVRLLKIAIPRIRDFRGLSPKAFDGRGCYTIGIKDHTIFPEIELDKVKRNLGMDITIVTTAKDKEATREVLTLIGLPLVKRETKTAETASAK
jgi:large subunit ribosomal protein L5